MLGWTLLSRLSVAAGSPVLAQLESKQVADRSSEICFHGCCTNLPIVVDSNHSYEAKSPNCMRGVFFNLNDIVDSQCDVYGSACLLALRVYRLSQAG